LDIKKILVYKDDDLQYQFIKNKIKNKKNKINITKCDCKLIHDNIIKCDICKLDKKIDKEN
jgi:hypothetical protein